MAPSAGASIVGLPHIVRAGLRLTQITLTLQSSKPQKGE
ncbi:hypothetical protein ABIB90_007262 [Bradyrhizobium sp. JR4.1]